MIHIQTLNDILQHQVMKLSISLGFFAVFILFIAVTHSVQIRCATSSVFKDGKCIECKQLLNTLVSSVLNDQIQNFCICQNGYQWLQDSAQCVWIGNIGVHDQGYGKDLYAKESQIIQIKQRNLQTDCDVSKGFISLDGQCVNCRNYNYSTGYSFRQGGCLCIPTFIWSIDNCKCTNRQSYIHQNTCSSCSQITDPILNSACNQCRGNPYASSRFGCVDCTSIPHGLYSQVHSLSSYCVCQTGYVYSSFLGACICDQYYFQKDSGCKSCAGLNDSKTINDCNQCQYTFFYNGFYCIQSSSVPNFNASADDCQIGYSIKIDPIRNQTIGCACATAAGNYLNGSSCLSCTSLKNNSVQSYQSCISCSQASGYFRGSVECIYCPSIQFSTGVATSYGCKCISGRSWNPLTNLCECDWAKGLFANGSLCLSCLTISHTLSSTNSASCQCIQGYSWNSNTLACECEQNTQNFYLPNVEGCVNCNQITGSTGMPINGSSCQCQLGRIWSSSQIGCVCDMSLNYVLIGTACLSCATIKKSSGLVNPQGCSCLPGYIWVSSQGICDCPQGYVNTGNDCVSCSMAKQNLTNVTFDGCNNCSSNQGFALLNGICYACSQQASTLGTVSNGLCDCLDNTKQVWNPILGGCTCKSQYYASKSNRTLVCSTCGSSCTCLLSSTATSGKKICSKCSSVLFSTGKSVGTNCVCYPGYVWSIRIGLSIYPFECICNSKAGGYLNGSVCYNCSQLPLNGSVTAAGCKNCDPTQGFLYIPTTQSCIVCALQQGSNGKATASGCGCIQGVWNSNSLACEYFNCSVANCQLCSSDTICYACADGYLRSIDKQHCTPNCFIAYCDQCSSLNTCQTCLLGYQLNSNSSRCTKIECFQTCFACLTSTNCSSCLSGYLLSNDSTQCFFDCKKKNCVLCDSQATCSQCAVGYHLQPGDASYCYIDCLVSNCLYCNTINTFCDYCNTSFIKSGGLCFYPVCISNCYLCSSETICSTCNIGYKTTNNGSSCQPVCAIINCLECPNISQCAKCIPGYYITLNSTQCLLNCSSANCQYCQGRPDNCSLCYQGLKLFEGQCYPSKCIDNCDLCFSNYTCHLCSTGYSPSYDHDQCLLACSSSSCQMCSQTPTNCSLCSYGYSLDSGQCFLDICDLPNCVLCSSPGSCQRCDPTHAYNLESNACQPACISLIANCMHCASADKCLTCKQGYGFITSQSNKIECLALCSIEHCAICLSSQNCLLCQANYSLSANQQQCQLACSVRDCDVCNNSQICSACLSGYRLINNNCILECPIGYYNSGNSSKINCALCYNNIFGCQQCSVINSSVICLACQITFFLKSYNCFSCQIYDSFCNSCDKNGCTSCIYSFTLVQGSCKQIECQVPNCITCLLSSSLICTACSFGFSYNTQTGACENPVCPFGFIFEQKSCICPIASMLISDQCLPCLDPNCESCDSTGCLSCIMGYYYSFDYICTACPANCGMCNYLSCIQCSLGFSMSVDGLCYSISQGVNAVMINNTFVACKLGCSTCSITIGNMLSCQSTIDLYSINSAQIFLCTNTTCRTCSYRYAGCQSCFYGYVLSNGYCYLCLDSNALSCSSTNFNYSLSCYAGYTSAYSSFSTGGFCLPCSQNCLKCDLNGPHQCDPFRCALGFVQLTGTTNCTACLNFCSVCDKNNINNCIDCGPRRYKDSTGQCLACPAGCANCTSQTVCTICLIGYTLVQNSCIYNLDYPCAVTGANSNCIQCFEGYRLNGTVCVPDLSCKNQSTCITCPYSYYISNSNCLICPDFPKNCLTCDTITGSCLGCKKGFYFTGYNCQSCPKKCNSCNSPKFCNQAASGFYLETLWDGSNSGKVKTCTSPCLTCVYSSNYCLSCQNGYVISGSTCFATSLINLSLVLGPSSSPPSIISVGDSDKTALAKVIQNINWLTTSFCSVLPNSIKINGSCNGVFRFTALYSGSVKLNVSINVNGVQNVAQTQAAIVQSLNSNGIPGASILVVSALSPPSAQPAAQTSSSSSSVIVIVVVVVASLVIVGIIIAVVIRRVYKKKKELDQISVPAQSVQSQVPMKRSISNKSDSKEYQIKSLTVSITSQQNLGQNNRNA